MVNFGKTKVMIFNYSKKSLSDFYFYFKVKVIEVTATYTHLGVQFSRPRLRLSLQPCVNKGNGSLALIDRQCSQHHFQDISSKLDHMEYSSQVWGLSLLELDLPNTKRVKIFLLCCISICKRTILQPIIQVEFATHPFWIETIFKLVEFAAHPF